MGKKSLTKSTTKKKAPARKKTGAVPKTAGAAKKPTLKSILNRNYGTWGPEPLFAVEPDPDYVNNFSAPPAVEEKDEKKAGQIRELLSLKFDLNLFEKSPSETKPDIMKTADALKAEADEKKSRPEPEAPAEEPKPVPKKKVSVAELIKQQYESWQPAKLYTPTSSEDAVKNYAAPPAIEASDADEISRIKDLLARQFDLTAPEMSAPPDPEKLREEPVPVGVPAEPAPEAKAAELKTEDETVKAEKKEAVKAEKKAPEPKPEPKKETPAPPEKEFGGPALPPPPSPPSPPTRSWEPPLSGPMMFLVGCLVVIFGILIIASSMNMSDYYLKQTDEGLEVWQGTFSPNGRKLLMTVPDARAPETEKEVYSKQEALTPVFDYYMLQAAKHTQEKGTLDLEGIRKILEEAKSYAVTPVQKQRVDARLNQIEYMSLVYKAEVAADEKTMEGYDRALSFLNQAASLKNIETSEKDLAAQKTAQVRDTRAALEAELKAARQAAEQKKAKQAAAADKKKAAVKQGGAAAKDQPAAGHSPRQDAPAKTVVEKPAADCGPKAAVQPH